MNEETFILVWQQLMDWNLKSKEQFKLGVDLSSHDKILYNCVINLLKLHFSPEQIDFLIWTIFEDDELIINDENKIKINSGNVCWEYINEL